MLRYLLKRTQIGYVSCCCHRLLSWNCTHRYREYLNQSFLVLVLPFSLPRTVKREFQWIAGAIEGPLSGIEIWTTVISHTWVLLPHHLESLIPCQGNEQWLGIPPSQRQSWEQIGNCREINLLLPTDKSLLHRHILHNPNTNTPSAHNRRWRAGNSICGEWIGRRMAND